MKEYMEHKKTEENGSERGRWTPNASKASVEEGPIVSKGIILF